MNFNEEEEKPRMRECSAQRSCSYVFFSSNVSFCFLCGSYSSSVSFCGLNQFVFDEVFGNLDGIGSGAFAQVVRHHPHVQASGV